MDAHPPACWEYLHRACSRSSSPASRCQRQCRGPSPRRPNTARRGHMCVSGPSMSVALHIRRDRSRRKSDLSLCAAHLTGSRADLLPYQARWPHSGVSQLRASVRFLVKRMPDSCTTWWNPLPPRPPPPSILASVQSTRIARRDISHTRMSFSPGCSPYF